MKRDNIFGKYFCGNLISEYGRQHGRVDYATLAKSFDAVLANGIIENTCEIGFWEQENGFVDNSEEIEELREELEELEACKVYTESGIFYEDENGDEMPAEESEKIAARIEEIREEVEELEEEQEGPDEIFQYFIISGNGAQILEDYTDEIVFYNETLDLYVWGVTHWGTAWDYVLTDIPCEVDETANA